MRHHLRLGFLVHEPQPLVAADGVRLPARVRAGRGRRDAAVGRRPPGHARGSRRRSRSRRTCALAARLLADALRWRAQGPPAPLLRGDELARELGIATGPRVGELLEELAEAQYAGELATREQALGYARSADRASAIVGCARDIGSRDGDPDCIFCKIVAGELPATIVDEDERTIAFMDIAPATRGHALVIPRAHTADLLSVDPEDLQAVALAAQRLAARAKERLGADGVNLLNSCGARRLADGLPLPRARDPALRRRSAAAAVGARAEGDPSADRGRRAGTRRAVAK